MDSHDSRKHEIAADLIDAAVSGEGFRISAQVLFEFANICQKKLGCTAQEVLKLLDGRRAAPPRISWRFIRGASL